GDLQTAFRDITGLEGAAVDGDGAGGDGQTEAFTAAGTVAGGIDAIEGLEDQLQILLGYAGSVIAHRDLDPVPPARRDHHGRSGRTIPHGIADDILEGTAQKLRIAGDLQPRVCVDRDGAISGVCFDGNVLRDVLQQIADVDGNALESASGPLQSDELQNACN